MYDNVRKPESDWYEAGYTAPRTDTAGTGCYDSYWSPSQAAAPKKKPHQGLKITMIILGVLVLIIASCYVFAGRGRDSISVDGDPGQHGSVTLPREDTDDDTTVTGKNELPTAPTDPSVTMTLQPAGGSALSLQSVYAKCLPSASASMPTSAAANTAPARASCSRAMATSSRTRTCSTARRASP